MNAVERYVNSIPGSNSRLLILGDNLGMILSFSRCRAKSFDLLTQVRRFSACCLARNLKAFWRRIPSEFNTADEGSRAFQASLSPDKSIVGSLIARFKEQHSNRKADPEGQQRSQEIK